MANAMEIVPIVLLTMVIVMAAGTMGMVISMDVNEAVMVVHLVGPIEIERSDLISIGKIL